MTQQEQPAQTAPDASKPIFDLVYNDLGKAVLAIHNENFRGVYGIEDLTSYRPRQHLDFSNLAKASSYDEILERLTSGKIRVASPEDVVRYWPKIPEKDTTYADCPAAAIFPDPEEDETLEGLRRAVLDGFDMCATRVPLIASSLRPVRAENNLGFSLEVTKLSRLREAPYLTRSQRVKYDPEKKDLVPAQDDDKEGVPIWVPKMQAGIRRICRNKDEGLDFRMSWLLTANGEGRIQVVQRSSEE